MNYIHLLVAAVCLSLFGTAAQAAIITVVPSTASVEAGTPFSVDLVISDLGDGAAPSVGIFDIDFGFDPALVGFVSATFGDQLDILGLGSLQDVDDSVAGTVNLFELSFDPADDLNDLQAGSFILATLTFNALSAGLSDLVVTILSLGDADGVALMADVVNSSIMVTDSTVIPLPGAIWLILSGVGALAFARKRTSVQ